MTEETKEALADNKTKKAKDAAAKAKWLAEVICGFCQTAGKVERSEIRSTTEPEGWHAMCSGRVENTDAPCNCVCRTWPGLCDHCGIRLPDATLPQCADPKPCVERVAQQRRNLERHEKWAKLQQDVLAQREVERGPVAPRPPRAERPTSGACEHCGEPTKGGKFVVGHDAKLKGDLLRAARSEDIPACVELMLRNWPCKDVHQGIMAKAVEAVNDLDDPAGWLAERVAARVQEAQNAAATA